MKMESGGVPQTPLLRLRSGQAPGLRPSGLPFFSPDKSGLKNSLVQQQMCYIVYHRANNPTENAQVRECVQGNHREQ